MITECELAQLRSEIMEVAHEKRDGREVEADLKRRISRCGDDWAAESQLRLLLGDLYYWMDRRKQSRAQYRRILDRDPSCVEAMIAMGKTFKTVLQRDKCFRAAYEEARAQENHAQQLQALDRIACDAFWADDAQALSNALNKMCDILATAPRMQGWLPTIARMFVVEGRGAEALPFMICAISHMLRCGYSWGYQIQGLHPFVEFWRRQGESDEAIRSRLYDMRSLACDEDTAYSFDLAVDWAFDKGHLYYDHIYAHSDHPDE